MTLVQNITLFLFICLVVTQVSVVTHKAVLYHEGFEGGGRVGWMPLDKL